MNRRARAERAMLRERRRYGAGATTQDMKAALRGASGRQAVMMRHIMQYGVRPCLPALFEAFAVGDGIAYIPSSALPWSGLQEELEVLGLMMRRHGTELLQQRQRGIEGGPT